MASHLMPEPQAVRAELERILASAPFATSHRSQRFLSYVVENSFEEAHESLKEYAIAVEVFERDSFLRSRDRCDGARRSRTAAQRGCGSITPGRAGTTRSSSICPRAAIAPPSSSAKCPEVLRLRPIRKEGRREPLRRRASATMILRSFLLPKASAAASCAGCFAGSWCQRWSFAGSLAGSLLGHARNPRSAASAKAPIVLAVLPFSNQTGSDANNYVTDGLTDNLIRQLSELPRLHVMARTAVERVSRQAVVSQLGVKVLLVGKLRRNSEGRLVLDSELSNANGTILRSSQYMADESDMPSVQADIVQDVIQGLGIELDARQSAGAQKPITTSPAAFQAFLRGDSAARDPSPQGMHAAPRTTRKLSGKIRSSRWPTPPWQIVTCSSVSTTSPHAITCHSHARYAERALAIDPSMHEAHGTLGLIHLVYDWDYAAAEKELAAADARESAIRALSCTAHLHLLGDQEHMRHAEEDLHRMLEFDPHSPGLINELGCVSYYAGRYADSIRYYREAIAADPQAAVTYWGLGRSLAREGHYSEALETLGASRP